VSHPGTRPGTRTVPLLIALSAIAFVVAACGDGDATGVEDELPSPSSPYPHVDREYDPTCDGLSEKLRDCGLLTEGPVDCYDLRPEVEECYFACYTEASCSLLGRAHCLGDAPPIGRCLERCEVFDCGDGSTILKSWVCDNEEDCLDGRDEIDCEYFTCENAQEVALNDVCDAFPDCLDYSDEMGCPTFTCENGAVIREGWRCDFEVDCLDGTDELDCPHFACESNGEKLPLSWKCDLEDDCLDGSDEFGCAQLLCR